MVGPVNVEDIREAVRAGGLFARDRPVVAMLSGGRDSTCLLDAAVALLGAPAVSALHVNYGLRESADADERHCAALCEALGVELEVAPSRHRSWRARLGRPRGRAGTGAGGCSRRPAGGQPAGVGARGALRAGRRHGRPSATL